MNAILSKSRRLDIVFISLLSLMLILGAGTWAGYSFTGITNTFAPGSLETTDINISGDWYRGSTNLTDILVYPEQAASYIIFNSSNAVWAKNVSTGQIDYGGTWDAGSVDGANASMVIENAIASIKASELGTGAILLKQGNYSIQTRLLVDFDGFTLRGVGQGTVLKATTDATTIFHVQGGSGTELTGVSIQDLKLIGTGAGAGIGILLEYADYARISGVDIETFGGYGIEITFSDRGIITQSRVYDCKSWAGIGWNSGESFIFSNNILEKNTQRGMSIGSAAYHPVIIGNVFKRSGTYGLYLSGADKLVTGNDFVENVAAGIYVASTGYVITISGNLFARNGWDGITPAAPGGCAIHLDRCQDIAITGNQMNHQYTGASRDGDGIHLDQADRVTISGNSIWDNPVSASDGSGIYIVNSNNITISGNTINENGEYGINIVSGSDISISNNGFYSNPSGAVFNGGTNVEYSNNLGFPTEKGGTQTCADNENIAHGIAGTPTFVSVTPMNDTYAGVPVIATVDWSGVDATNIRVGLYWTNGTAISADVIFVSWMAEYDP